MLNSGLVTIDVTGDFTPTVAVVRRDEDLIDLWLNSKPSENTREAYRRDIDMFLAFIEFKPFQRVTLNDVQAFEQSLERLGQGKSTIARRMYAVKSLLTYGHSIGVLAVNAGKPHKPKEESQSLTDRILAESAVMKMIHGYKGSDRNLMILKFLYATGCRVSELCKLTCKQCQETDQGMGRIRFLGKGKKNRTILIRAELWQDLQRYLQGKAPDAPVFESRNHKAMSRSQINRIVTGAASQAGLSDRNVSPHWFRHAHASHSLQRGANINLVGNSLGHENLNTTRKYLHDDPSDSSGLYLPV
jgi:integrase/recombinase XerD